MSRRGAAVADVLDTVKQEWEGKISAEPHVPDVKNRADLRDYIFKAFGAKLPEIKCCPDHTAPWDVFCEAYFVRHPVIVLKGSRGLAGKTWFLGLLSLTEAVLLKADVTIIGGSGGQSKRVNKAIGKFWNEPGAPRHLINGDPGITKTTFKAGNEIEALTASQRSVRSPHPQRLRLDEVDEMDLRIFNAAMGQTMADRGIAAQTLIASTHQNPAGTFTEVMKMAAEKGWAFREWCYKETLKPHGWLDPSEVSRKRSEMTQAMWDTEVELQEPSSEGLAIERDSVERMFTREAGESEGKPGEEEEFEGPNPAGSYATGGDWGKSKDYTAIPTLRSDVRPMRFVAYYRQRKQPYHVMVPHFNDRVKRFGGTACHDAHGVGEVVDEMLTVETEPFTHWQGAERIKLFSDYITAIERGDVIAPYSKPWYDAHKYVTNDDLYGNGHPPDEFIGCALAYRASRNTPPPKKRAGVWGGARR